MSKPKLPFPPFVPPHRPKAVPPSVGIFRPEGCFAGSLAATAAVSGHFSLATSSRSPSFPPPPTTPHPPPTTTPKVARRSRLGALPSAVLMIVHRYHAPTDPLSRVNDGSLLSAADRWQLVAVWLKSLAVSLASRRAASLAAASNSPTVEKSGGQRSSPTWGGQRSGPLGGDVSASSEPAVRLRVTGLGERKTAAAFAAASSFSETLQTEWAKREQTLSDRQGGRSLTAVPDRAQLQMLWTEYARRTPVADDERADGDGAKQPYGRRWPAKQPYGRRSAKQPYGWRRRWPAKRPYGRRCGGAGKAAGNVARVDHFRPWGCFTGRRVRAHRDGAHRSRLGSLVARGQLWPRSEGEDERRACAIRAIACVATCARSFSRCATTASEAALRGSSSSLKNAPTRLAPTPVGLLRWPSRARIRSLVAAIDPELHSFPDFVAIDRSAQQVYEDECDDETQGDPYAIRPALGFPGNHAYEGGTEAVMTLLTLAALLEWGPEGGRLEAMARQWRASRFRPAVRVSWLRDGAAFSQVSARYGTFLARIGTRLRFVAQGVDDDNDDDDRDRHHRGRRPAKQPCGRHQGQQR